MSIDVTKAFLILVQSVTKIAVLAPKNKDLKICIKQGATEVSIQVPEVKSSDK